MIKFRGFRVDAWGWVQGFLVRDEGKFCIQTEVINRIFHRFEVHPESLAIADTNLKDKSGRVIFASFEYEEGKMSRGGDIFAGYYPWEVYEFKFGKYFVEADTMHSSNEIGHGFHLGHSYATFTYRKNSFTLKGDAYNYPKLLEEKL